jgi:Flp pilus assembly protein TadG
VFAKKFIRDSRGNAAVEFALVFPLFLIFIFGTFYIGWVTYGTYTVHHAVVQSARILQLNPTTTQGQLQTFVRSKVDAVGGSSNVTVTLTMGAASNGTQLARATATYPMSFVVPLLGTYSFNYTTSTTVAITAN